MRTLIIFQLPMMVLIIILCIGHLSFLIFGLLVDVTFLFTKQTASQSQRDFIIFVYSLVESLFFAWFIFKTSGSSALTFIARILFFVFLVLWGVQYFITAESNDTF